MENFMVDVRVYVDADDYGDAADHVRRMVKEYQDDGTGEPCAVTDYTIVGVAGDDFIVAF